MMRLIIILLLLIKNILVFSQSLTFEGTKVIKAFSQGEKSYIEVTLNKDTIYGPYKVWNNKGVLIQEGVFDNRKHNYKANDTSTHGDFLAGVYSREIKEYQSKIKIKDTGSFVNYVYRNSFYTLKKFYYPNGKIERNYKYKVIKPKNDYILITTDTCVGYSQEGGVSDSLITTLINNHTFKHDHREFHVNTKIVSYSHLSIINYFEGSEHNIASYYDKSGKVTSAQYFFKDNGFSGRLDFDSDGKLIKEYYK